jgi:hypothetical protein
MLYREIVAVTDLSIQIKILMCYAGLLPKVTL